ncbi:MAG: signal peptidase I [Nitrospinae bacterium]|nr:signal peptidase I [Nitrospinota bacterium]
MANGTQPPRQRGKGLLREYIEAILVALIAALLIRTFVAQAFRIPSGSMIPTLLVGDQLLVDKVAYRFRPPARGDIVVFKYPGDESRDFIKRVIGLPGDIVEVRAKAVYINGAPLNERYAFHDAFDHMRIIPRDDFGPVTVPPDKYFVMGDNRENSQDSRFWGFLERDKIIGRAFILYWSRDVDPIFPLGIRWGRFGLLIE